MNTSFFEITTGNASWWEPWRNLWRLVLFLKYVKICLFIYFAYGRVLLIIHIYIFFLFWFMALHARKEWMALHTRIVLTAEFRLWLFNDFFSRQRPNLTVWSRSIWLDTAGWAFLSNGCLNHVIHFIIFRQLCFNWSDIRRCSLFILLYYLFIQIVEHPSGTGHGAMAHCHGNNDTDTSLCKSGRNVTPK